MKPSSDRIIRSCVWLSLIGIALFVSLDLVRGDHLWDFKSYYGGAAAALRGDNPYDIESVNTQETPTNLPFVYSPLAISFFVPFTALSYSSAAKVWGLVILLTSILLIRLWMTQFAGRHHSLWLLLLCLLGFNGTLVAAARTGNVAIVVSLLLWYAFYFYVRGAAVAFVMLVLSASVFKLTPLFFLGLLIPPFTGVRPVRYRAALVAGLSCVVTCIAAAVFMPNAWVRSFSGLLVSFGSPSSADRGSINPSVGALIRDIVSRLPIDTTLSGTLGVILYGLVVVVVGTMAWRAFDRLGKASIDPPEKRMWGVIVWCLVYALILPRFKNYSYVLLILPAYFVIVNAGFVSGKAVVVVLAVLSTAPQSWVPLHRTALAFFWDYFPYVFTVGLGVLVIGEINALTQKSDKSTTGP